MTDTPRWFTSSYSENGGACIEAAANLTATRGIVPIRDSKHPDGPVVRVSVHAFAALVTEIKSAGGAPR